MNDTPSPPQFFHRLFRWMCKDELYDELAGDLLEEYQYNLGSKGTRKARNIYRAEVLRMIRASVIKKLLFKRRMTLSLLRMNVKLSLRNLLRHKVFSAVNVLGLAAALTICLFFVNLIFTGLKQDQQHSQLDRIYRVEMRVTNALGDITDMATLPFPAVDMLQQDIPGLEEVAHVSTAASAMLNVNGQEVEITGLATEASFLNIFDIEALQGDLADVYRDINSIAITQDIADRFYPDTYAVGQTTRDGKVIRAVVPTPRGNSHLIYDMIQRLDDSPAPTGETIPFRLSWSAYYDSYAYVLLPANADLAQLDNRLGLFTDKVNRLSGLEVQLNFKKRAIAGIVFSEPVMNEIGTVIGSEGLIVFITMILVMVMISCFNYANLSVARALQRTKEIGVRKVSGSTNGQIRQQVFTETICFALLALVLAVTIYYYLSYDFPAVLPFFANIFEPGLSLELLLVFVGFAVFTGLVAGFFPALFFAKIRPLRLFNSQAKPGKLSFSAIRKVLITFQLGLSMFTVLFTLLMYKQVKHIGYQPMGFETENRVVVKTEPEKAALLKSLMTQVSGVEAVTVTSAIPGVSIQNIETFRELVSGDSSIAVGFFYADEDFLNTLSPKLRDGRFFDPARSSAGSKQVVVNQRFLSLLKIQPEEAVGYQLNTKQASYSITGVIADISMGNPFMPTEEALMMVNATEAPGQGNLLLKLADANTQQLGQLEAAWKEVHPDLRFEPQLLNTFIDEPLAEFLNLVKAQGIVCLAIIAVSLLGQLGMALYNAETRVKEIGVRKVLGAQTRSIIRLLLKGTLGPLIIATVVACPLSYQLFLDGIAVDMRSPFQPDAWPFVLGVLSLSTLVLGLVASQTWRIARLNPAHTLRAE